MNGSIKEWPENERPREKMQIRGTDALTDAELLALILRTGDHASGQSAIDLGRNIILTFGDLRKVAAATLTELCNVKGVGPAKATSILAALGLAGRVNSDRLESLERFTSPLQIFNHFHFSFRDRRKEYFLTLLLDGKIRIIRQEQISEGSLNQSIVHPREVFIAAVKESAAAVILVHNHPSGDPAPSREDREITRRLKESGEIMGIRVLDHIIIGDGSYYSFVEMGLL
ncbi:MAG: JAB domain-containing protein [Geobacter sp.]|nr:JAB domain-containing protein [Geobacter sp.]